MLRTTGIGRGVGVVILALLVSASQAKADEPLFAFVQISDSQPDAQSHVNRLISVLSTIADAGQADALLPHPVSFVIFPGDFVDDDEEDEWEDVMELIDEWLTDKGIPYRGVPGNRDHSSGNFDLYETHVGPRGAWTMESSTFIGHNGVNGATGWSGLRFVGVNTSYDGDSNEVAPGDLGQAARFVQAASGGGENIFLVGHYQHDASNDTPLQDQLEDRSVIGYMRGNVGSPHVQRGMDGIENPDVWDLNSNAIFNKAVLIYYEVFEDEIHAYLLRLVQDPTSLPPRQRIELPHDMRPSSMPGVHVAEPSGDARVKVGSSSKYGSKSLLRVRAGTVEYNSYLRFDMTNFQSQFQGPVGHASLRLYVTNGSDDAGSVFPVDGDWVESTINGVNAPTIGEQTVASGGVASSGEWVSFDVTPLASGQSTLELALRSSSSNSALFSSREGEHPPQLWVIPDGPPTVFHPTADARVKSSSGNRNYGNSSYLRLRGGSGTDYHSHLLFIVSGIERPIEQATLRLYVTDDSNDGGAVYATGQMWSEDGLSFNNAPPAVGPPLDSIGSVDEDNWIELDVSAAIESKGVYGFVLVSDSTNSVRYSSREGSHSPELVIRIAD